MSRSDKLSKRESEVVHLLLQGKSNKLISSALGISERTVEFHLKNIYAKFQVSTRVELILKLGNATGTIELKELGSSTVENIRKNAENGEGFDPEMGWAASLRNTVSIIGKELIMKVLMKNPSAFLPPVMSLIAFATVIIHISLFGTARQPDEGTAAHIWQILMAGQLPIIAFFIFKWVPRAPIKALAVLALQGGSAFLALAPVFILKL